jgi:DNA-binding transcriptional ArsR family regulator
MSPRIDEKMNPQPMFRSHQIPDRLAAQLPKAQKAALGHVGRREILRALLQDVKDLSPAAVADSGLVPGSVSAAAYHMARLGDAHLIEYVAPGGRRPTTTARISSEIGNRRAVLEVLAEAAASDRVVLAEMRS